MKTTLLFLVGALLEFQRQTAVCLACIERLEPLRIAGCVITKDDRLRPRALFDSGDEGRPLQGIERRSRHWRVRTAYGDESQNPERAAQGGRCTAKLLDQRVRCR